MRFDRRRPSQPRRTLVAALAGLLAAVGIAASGPARAADGQVLADLGRHLAGACDFAETPWCQLPGRVQDSYIKEIEALLISGGHRKARNRLWGWGGPEETFGAWGGAAFDGRRFYFFGGGGGHYGGNDLKVYDLATLRWSRLYDPAPIGEDGFPEAGPRSAHVYDGLTYEPATNALYLFGHGNRHAWAFDLDSWAQTGEPWEAWQPFPLPTTRKGKPFGYFRTEAVGDGQILVHAGSTARGRGSMFVLDVRTRAYGVTAGETFRTSALTRADGAVYGLHAKGGALVRYDTLGRSFERFDMPAGFTGEASAYHPRRGLLVFWDGGPETLAFDTRQATWHQIGLLPQGAVPSGRKNGVWGGWAYVPRHDVFVGLAYDATGTPAMWAYRLPDPLPAEHPLKGKRIAEGYTCSDEVVGWECPDLQAQVDQGQVAKGVYRQCATVRRPVDFNGAWLTGAVCGRKAALIARDGAEIANVRISDISIGSNAACVRWEGGDVVLENLTCRASDMGVLGNGSRLVIIDSEIADSNPGGRSLGHLVYACAREAEDAELIVRNSRIANPGDSGHVLKSGCARTLVETSTLAGGERPYSRVVDAFNGGALELRNTRLIVGSDGGNGDVIGYGAEQRAHHRVNIVSVTGGRIDCRASARIRHTLHLWPERTLPSAVRFEPSESLACPKL